MISTFLRCSSVGSNRGRPPLFLTIFTTGKTERVVEQVERNERHQAHQRDKPPALCRDTLHQAPQTPADMPRHPLPRYGASQQEGSGGTQGRTDQIPQGAPDRTKQGTAGETKNGAG